MQQNSRPTAARRLKQKGVVLYGCVLRSGGAKAIIVDGFDDATVLFVAVVMVSVVVWRWWEELEGQKLCVSGI